MADSWTDAEKSNLLLQVIAQIPEKGINWSVVHLEGRTAKACREKWHRYLAQHKQQVEGAGGKAGTPAKAKRAPGSQKRKSKKEQVKTEDDDDEDALTPTKKARARKTKLEDNIDVPQPQTLEEVNQYRNPKRNLAAKVEDCI